MQQAINQSEQACDLCRQLRAYINTLEQSERKAPAAAPVARHRGFRSTISANNSDVKCKYRLRVSTSLVGVYSFYTRLILITMLSVLVRSQTGFYLFGYCAKSNNSKTKQTTCDNIYKHAANQGTQHGAIAIYRTSLILTKIVPSLLGILF